MKGSVSACPKATVRMVLGCRTTCWTTPIRGILVRHGLDARSSETSGALPREDFVRNLHSNDGKGSRLQAGASNSFFQATHGPRSSLAADPPCSEAAFPFSSPRDETPVAAGSGERRAARGFVPQCPLRTGTGRRRFATLRSLPRFPPSHRTPALRKAPSIVTKRRFRFGSGYSRSVWHLFSPLLAFHLNRTRCQRDAVLRQRRSCEFKIRSSSEYPHLLANSSRASIPLCKGDRAMWTAAGSVLAASAAVLGVHPRRRRRVYRELALARAAAIVGKSRR
jgi:hypothetical protein